LLLSEPAQYHVTKGEDRESGPGAEKGESKRSERTPFLYSLKKSLNLTAFRGEYETKQEK